MSPLCRALVAILLASCNAPAGSTEQARSAAAPSAAPANPPPFAAPANPPPGDTRTELELALPSSPPLPPAIRYIEIDGTFDARDGSGEMADGGRFHLRGECWSRRFSTLRDASASATATYVRATLYDAEGRVLDDRALDAGADNDDVNRFGFGGCVADHRDGRRLVVRRGAVVFLDARASPHQPVLRTLFPTPDIRLVDRRIPDVLHWTATDDDGPHYLGETAPYAIRHAISYDGTRWSEEWSGSITWDAMRDVKVPADQFLFPSGDILSGPSYGLEHVWLETEISDGFWSTIEVVGPFRVRDCDAPPGFPATDDPCDPLDRARFGADARPDAHP